MASELPATGLSLQSNDKNRSEGIFHTMSLVAHACPSALHCCSSHICEPIQSHCGPHPMFDSTFLRTYLPTKSLPAWHHDHWDQSFHPICHPISPNHRPHSVQPICQCILCCHHVHHTSHPTCQSYQKWNHKYGDKFIWKITKEDAVISWEIILHWQFWINVTINSMNENLSGWEDNTKHDHKHEIWAVSSQVISSELHLKEERLKPVNLVVLNVMSSKQSNLNNHHPVIAFNNILEKLPKSTTTKECSSKTWNCQKLTKKLCRLYHLLLRGQARSMCIG